MVVRLNSKDEKQVSVSLKLSRVAENQNFTLVDIYNEDDDDKV